MIYLSTYFEIAAFLASLLGWRHMRTVGYLRCFPLLLFGIVAGELSGAYFTSLPGEVNARIYNLFITPFINTMYYIIVYKAIQHPALKKGIIFFSVLYVPFAVLTTLYLYSGKGYYNILSHCVGALFLISILIRLFYEMMINPAELDFLKNPSFYIFFSLLLFYVASLAYFTMANWLGTHHRFIRIVYEAFDLLNYVLYGTYIISFLWIRLKDTY